MAQVKNYGLAGVGRNVQLGKQGPKIEGNPDTGAISFTSEGGVLTPVSGANAVTSSQFVTKAQLETVKNQEATFTASFAFDGGDQVLGTVPAGTKTVITTVNVVNQFDNNSIVTVGFTGNESALMADSFNDISLPGSYQAVTTATFSVDTQLSVYVTQNNSTQGSGTVVVSYY